MWHPLPLTLGGNLPLSKQRILVEVHTAGYSTGMCREEIGIEL
jgi:hypothetical protein